MFLKYKENGDICFIRISEVSEIRFKGMQDTSCFCEIILRTGRLHVIHISNIEYETKTDFVNVSELMEVIEQVLFETKS